MNLINKIRYWTVPGSLLIIVLIVAGLIPVNTYAYRLYLKGAPITRFTPEDTEIMESSIQHALSENADGTVSRWENPKSKNHGEITILETMKLNDKLCRKISLHNVAHNYAEAQNEYIFCKDGEHWNLMQPLNSNDKTNN